jgi:hypothetical protein
MEAAEKGITVSNDAVEFIPDHVTHESAATMNMVGLIDRAETIMRRYPWVMLTMGVGLGYVASRRLP